MLVRQQMNGNLPSDLNRAVDTVPPLDPYLFDPLEGTPTWEEPFQAWQAALDQILRDPQTPFPRDV